MTFYSIVLPRSGNKNYSEVVSSEIISTHKSLNFFLKLFFWKIDITFYSRVLSEKTHTLTNWIKYSLNLSHYQLCSICLI